MNRKQDMGSFYQFAKFFGQSGEHSLRIVSRISLVTGIAALVLLLVSVFFLTDQTGTRYADIVYAHSLTQKHLKPVLLISGLCLLGFVAFTTWLITLYSSFKVVGPLFRFSRNFEAAGTGQKPLGVRKDDELQDLSHLLQESITTLQDHYQELDTRLATTLKLLEGATEQNSDEINRELEQIRDLINKVKFDA